MPLDEQLDRIVGLFARHTGDVDDVLNDKATSEAMIARAEYELQQLQRDLDAVRLEPLVWKKSA